MANLKLEGAEQLRVLTTELKAADRALILAMRRNLRAATLPAREAVRAEELAVLPKRGGLNKWVAETPVRVRITSGRRSAGVRIVQSKPGRAKPHDLFKANEEGLIRHPNRGGPGWSIDRRDKAGGWSDTRVPVGFFERPLLALEPAVGAAMKAVMDETAKVAGFK